MPRSRARSKRERQLFSVSCRATQQLIVRACVSSSSERCVECLLELHFSGLGEFPPPSLLLFFSSKLLLCLSCTTWPVVWFQGREEGEYKLLLGIFFPDITFCLGEILSWMDTLIAHWKWHWKVFVGQEKCKISALLCSLKKSFKKSHF